MKYLCLAYYDEKKSDALPARELEAIVSRCPAYDADLLASGHLVAKGSLQSPRSSATVRPRHGSASVTDGPFAGTTEQIGGFFVIEARDLNEAIRIASKHPAAHLGEEVGWGVEVRPMDAFELA